MATEKVKMGIETDNGSWKDYYDCQFPFYINGRMFFYGQSKSGTNWFIQELLSDGKRGIETDHGFRKNYNYYDCQFPFYINGRMFFYGQSKNSYNWCIQELLPDGKMGIETDNGSWKDYYDCQFPFYINGRTFFYGQSKSGTNWFIQELLSDGKMGIETDHGFRKNYNYYDCQFPFYINGRTFFYGQSKNSYNWCIQELLPDGKMGIETDNGSWKDYYDCQFPFYINGRTFFYGQSKSGTNWFIQELLSDGKMGIETDHGFRKNYNYYDCQFPFYINGRMFFYGQNKSSYNWCIQDFSLCKEDNLLYSRHRRHFTDYKLASWNMQGALSGSESKWSNIVSPEVNDNSNIDIFALQESGTLPGSVSPLANKAPQTLIASRNNDIELTQNLWPLGTRSRPNDVYVYHVENGNGYNRTSMAIVSRHRADEVFIVGPVNNASRPVIGIRHGADYFFNIHAGAHINNEVPSMIRVIEDYMSGIIANNPNVTWVIMGDYNRDPHGLELLNAPSNIERGFAVPGSPTHFGGCDRTLDYAITGAGIGNQRTLSTSVSRRRLSDHIVVFFISLMWRSIGRCAKG